MSDPTCRRAEAHAGRGVRPAARAFSRMYNLSGHHPGLAVVRRRRLFGGRWLFGCRWLFDGRWLFGELPQIRHGRIRGGVVVEDGLGSALPCIVALIRCCTDRPLERSVL